MLMHGPSILLVDDDAMQLDLVSAQLNNLGYSDIVLARSGEVALDHFARLGSQIGVVICDLSMPDMDGLVFMRHLAQRGFAASFILLSGTSEAIMTSAAGLAKAHDLNLLGVLGKPSSPERIRSLLDARQERAPYRSNALEDQCLTPAYLDAALGNGEFVPWYQPKVDVGTGKAISLEALARWPQRSGSLISPGRFVPAMESSGMADKLFFAIAGTVLADLVRWRSQGIFLKAAINMSMETALNLTMPEQLLSLVHAAGVQPSDLIIEVTESKLLIERSLGMETLTRLSLMGFVLSIDDFGTGFSSLVQLVDLPFQELKIDGSFVRRARTERKAEAVLRLSLTIGLTLGIDVVAEGVETADQLAFLRDCGGTTVQGYHFASPMPFEACTTWLSA